MFERFTDSARQVVVGALEEARRAGDPFLDCSHLLLGVAAVGGPGGAALERAGVTTDRLRGALGAAGALDAAALAALGIDLEPVRAAAESAFGAGALDRPARPPARRRTSGHLPFTGRARTALERSLHAATHRGDAAIDTRHLLLGVLDAAEPRATAALRQFGVDPEDLRRQAEGDAAA